MIEEEKYTSQDSIPDFSFNGADFDFMWQDCMAALSTNIPQNLLVDDEPPVEASTSSDVHFDQIPVVANENSSDYQSYVTVDVLSPPGPSSLGETPRVSPISTKNWLGDYGFDIHFDELKQQPPKGANWIYSSKQDKLYVKKDVACPIKFETNQLMTCDTSIRAMAVFDDVRYAFDVVQRCYNHYKQDNDKGIPYAEHLIKCEYDQAHYKQDPESKRLSVSVQYENPQCGEKYSTYIFKFTCLGSCIGGINRRTIKIVFTLERGGKTIGRRALDVRICACPRRDICNDEKRLFDTKEEKQKTAGKNSKKKRPKSDDDDDPSLPNSIGGQHSKKPRCSSTRPPNGPYCITTNDRKQYHFLKQMQKLYLMHEAFESGPPHIKQLFQNSVSGLSESSTEDTRETDESDC